MEVAEEYCWAITQLAGQLHCGWSGPSVSEFWFQLNSLLYIHIKLTTRILNCQLLNIRHVTEHQERNNCVTRRVSVVYYTRKRERVWFNFTQRPTMIIKHLTPSYLFIQHFNFSSSYLHLSATHPTIWRHSANSALPSNHNAILQSTRNSDKWFPYISRQPCTVLITKPKF